VVPRLLLTIVVALSLLCATSCGNVFIHGALVTARFQGTVSSVQVNVNGSVQITFVSFEQSGSPLMLGFCGDQASFFPLHHTVTVNFNSGQFCATVVGVEITV
jgi:hypothetical protein